MINVSIISPKIKQTCRNSNCNTIFLHKIMIWIHHDINPDDFTVGKIQDPHRGKDLRNPHKKADVSRKKKNVISNSVPIARIPRHRIFWIITTSKLMYCAKIRKRNLGADRNSEGHDFEYPKNGGNVSRSGESYLETFADLNSYIDIIRNVFPTRIDPLGYDLFMFFPLNAERITILNVSNDSCWNSNARKLY